MAGVFTIFKKAVCRDNSAVLCRAPVVRASGRRVGRGAERGPHGAPRGDRPPSTRPRPPPELRRPCVHGSGLRRPVPRERGTRGPRPSPRPAPASEEGGARRRPAAGARPYLRQDREASRGRRHIPAAVVPRRSRSCQRHAGHCRRQGAGGRHGPPAGGHPAPQPRAPGCQPSASGRRHLCGSARRGPRPASREPGRPRESRRRPAPRALALRAPRAVWRSKRGSPGTAAGMASQDPCPTPDSALVCRECHASRKRACHPAGP